MTEEEMRGLARLLADDDFAKDLTLGISPEKAIMLDQLRILHPWQDERYSNSDIGNGCLFADYCKETVRFVSERKCWYVYDGQAWRADLGGLRAMEKRKELALLLFLLTAEITDTTLREICIKRASGLSHKIYAELSLEDREAVDARFAELKGIAKGEKFLRNAFQRETRELKNVTGAKAAAIDAKEAEAKAVQAAEALAAAADAATVQSNPKLVIFLASFGIIIREGLEAILIIAAIIAYMIKSGNDRINSFPFKQHTFFVGCAAKNAWLNRDPVKFGACNCCYPIK